MKHFILVVTCCVFMIGLTFAFDDAITSDKREPCCADNPNPEIEKPLECPKVIGNELFVCPQPCKNECTNDFDCPGDQVCCCRCGNVCLDGVAPSPPGGWPAA